jgi:hypothetical protein
MWSIKQRAGAQGKSGLPKWPLQVGSPKQEARFPTHQGAS